MFGLQRPYVGKHIYKGKESGTKALEQKNKSRKRKSIWENMLEMIMGQPREKKKIQKKDGKVQNQGPWKRNGSFLYKKRDEAGIERAHTDAAPLPQDHRAYLKYPKSFLISVHDQPFPSPRINLLMLF